MSPVAITLSLLLFSIVMFVWEKIPLAATAMIVCITLVVTGVFDVKRLLRVLLIRTLFYLWQCSWLAAPCLRQG